MPAPLLRPPLESRIKYVGRLYEKIVQAVKNDRFIVSWHADERCEEREITVWQLIAGIDESRLVRERPRSKPHPSVVLKQELSDGTEVELIWAWLAETSRAKLVTVYFRE
jgi:hypothetical protein